jgi:uncharacterized membrane protein
MAIAPPVLYFTYCYAMLSNQYGMIVGPFAVVMAALYVGFSHKVFKTAFEDKMLCTMYLTIAAAFLTIAVPIQLRGYWVAWGWAVEAAVLFLIGFQLDSIRTRMVGIAIFGLAIMDILGNTSMGISQYNVKAFSDLRFPTYLAVTALISLAAYICYRKRDTLTNDERLYLQPSLVLGALALLLAGLSVELYLWARADIGSLAASVVLTLLWLVYGIVVIVAGIQYKSTSIRVFALLLFGIALLKTFFADVWQVDMAWRIIAFIALGVMLLVASYLYQKYRPQVVQLVAGKGDNDEQK